MLTKPSSEYPWAQNPAKLARALENGRKANDLTQEFIRDQYVLLGGKVVENPSPDMKLANVPQEVFAPGKDPILENINEDGIEFTRETIAVPAKTQRGRPKK